MTTVDQVADAIAEQILKPMEVRTVDHIPEDIQYPAGLVGPPRINYDNLDESGVVYEIDVFLFVSGQIGRNQKRLYPWMVGPDSVHNRLQNNRNLGFDDVDARAIEARGTGQQEYASYRSYGGVVTVQVILS